MTATRLSRRRYQQERRCHRCSERGVLCRLLTFGGEEMRGCRSLAAVLGRMPNLSGMRRDREFYRVATAAGRLPRRQVSNRLTSCLGHEPFAASQRGPAVSIQRRMLKERPHRYFKEHFRAIRTRFVQTSALRRYTCRSAYVRRRMRAFAYGGDTDLRPR